MDTEDLKNNVNVMWYEQFAQIAKEIPLKEGQVTSASMNKVLTHMVETFQKFTVETAGYLEETEKK